MMLLMLRMDQFHIPTDKFRTKAEKDETQETKIAIFQKFDRKQFHRWNALCSYENKLTHAQRFVFERKKVIQSSYEPLLLMALCFPIHLAFSLSLFELMTF